MTPVYAIASHVIAPLATGTASLWEAVAAGKTGVAQHEDAALSPASFWGARFTPEQWSEIAATAPAHFLPFEKLAYAAVKGALQQAEGTTGPDKTILILSSTKGAIDHLNELPDERLNLHHSAALLSEALGFGTKPVVVSHACVSGVSALAYGKLLLQMGRCEQAVVVGADQLSRFVLSGFQSFQAIADGPCRPFDAARSGINLGEAGACIVLSTDKNAALARLAGSSSSNDANHISGPSRTGKELALAISRALQVAGISPGDIDIISAHGTATAYNDEMEAKAFARAGLLRAPVHSIKGSTGHTLGAAGIVESALLIESLRRQRLLPSTGFEHLGVSEPLEIATAADPAALKFALKTASGFGGCNSVAVWEAVALPHV